MSIVALPLPRRIRGGGSLFFITVTARFTFFYYRRGSDFLFVVAARQRQMFSRDGHLWMIDPTESIHENE
jgi:hypothetical protein